MRFNVKRLDCLLKRSICDIICIRVTKKEYAENLLAILNKMGYEWNAGNSLLEVSYFDEHTNVTYYYINIKDKVVTCNLLDKIY